MYDLELAESCLQSEEKAGQGLLDILMDGRFLPKHPVSMNFILMTTCY